MINAELKSEDIFYFTIDTSIFSESVITKALYWYTEYFDIYWSKKSDSVHEIILKLKPNTNKSYTFEYVASKFNQDLIDYKNRDLIMHETKDIRNILYVKAFANNDDFDDFNLTSE
ncbi:His-Xaa-Ser system protein HxsD [Bacteroides sp. K03]|uniref:His-Xaa-Ser system protein HxsD n=1 Tax=Bacteroides sp. K03 TaxID=2718928 RepID=UPI001C8C04F6|nr:His-Xaa-Ser system protein HxsD [Bacteroides sp. K03]MBX9188555.1 His-Xaa-Ser system protein HxsD [Bacteroides sp. K03]